MAHCSQDLKETAFVLCLILAYHEQMHWILPLLLSSFAWADPTAVLNYRTPVFQQPNEESKILFYLKAGETVELPRDSGGGAFRRVRVNSAGKWKSGYVPKVALEESLDLDLDSEEYGRWGFGGGLAFSYLRQKSRSFTTEDEVRYTTSDYVSSAINPSLSLQSGFTNFWRFSLIYQHNNYKGTASTDVSGAPSKTVILNHTMIAALIEKAYFPLASRGLYFGGGVEVAKALSVSLTLDSTPLSTSDQALPVYYGVQGVIGWQLKFAKRVSFASEIRLGVVPNQSPIVYGFDLGACLLYWL